MRLAHKLAALVGVIALTQMATAAPMYGDETQGVNPSVGEDDVSFHIWKGINNYKPGGRDGWVAYTLGWATVVAGQEQPVGSEGKNPFSLTIPTDCVDAVVLLHWGGGSHDTGNPNQEDEPEGLRTAVLYTGLTGGQKYEFSFEYTQIKNNGEQTHSPGISGAWIYCPPSDRVPDGGATVALLGLGLIGLGLVQRRR
ncbi:MAG: motif [Verrucomicrobiota bacterium]|jgi:hypothetical protein